MGMDLAAAKAEIEAAFEKMRSAFGAVVFDEWAIIALGEKTWKLVHYTGPRGSTFNRDLAADLKPLAATSNGKVHAIGDFEFAADARGTKHDAMMRLGGSAYLVCNNTVQAMAEIRSSHRWLATQRFFASLSQSFQSDPLLMGAVEP